MRKNFFYIFLIFLFILLSNITIILGKTHYPFDFEGYHYPFLQYIFQNLALGKFPLWDTQYSGMPLINNAQAELFYPVHLFLFYALIFSKINFNLYIMQYLNILHFILAGIGIFYFLKEIGFSKEYSFVGSLFFSGNGFFIAQSQHLGLIEAIAWLPWILFLIHKTLAKQKITYSAALGLILSLVFSTGFLPQIFSIFGISFFYAIYLMAKDKRNIGKNLKYLSLAILFFLSMGAIIYLPIIEYYNYIITLEFHNGIPPLSLATLMVPNFFNSFSMKKLLGTGRYNLKLFILRNVFNHSPATSFYKEEKKLRFF